MNINKTVEKCLCSSSMALGVWAILSGIACAANEEIESADDINLVNEKVNTALDLANKAQQTADKAIAQARNSISNTNISMDILGLDVDLWIYILLGICVLIILGILFLINQRISDNRKFKSDIRNLKNEVDNLKREMKNLVNEENKKRNTATIDRQQKEIFNYRADNEAIGRQNLNEIPKNIQQNIRLDQMQPKPKLKTPEDEYEELQVLPIGFVNKYNGLYKSSGYEAKQARKNFEQDFQIKNFTCDNYEKRISELSAIREAYSEPTFKDSGANGMYWATQVKDNIYAVVPRFNISYENQLHEMAGMKEAFISNYNGGAYKRIRVIKPALFSYLGGSWKLEKQGKIELSR